MIRLLMIVMSFIALLIPILSHAKDYKVTNTSSSGAGSLEQTIKDLNASGGEKENEIIFDIPQSSGSIDTAIPAINKPVTFKNLPGQDVKINSNGIWADKSFGIDTLSGDVSNGCGWPLFYRTGYGIYAGENIRIGTISGNVRGTGWSAGYFGSYFSGYGLNNKVSTWLSCTSRINDE
jgi:hypothetical protein